MINTQIQYVKIPQNLLLLHNEISFLCYYQKPNFRNKKKLEMRSLVEYFCKSKFFVFSNIFAGEGRGALGCRLYGGTQGRTLYSKM